MTLIQAIADARTWARATTSSHTDTQVMAAISDGQREFAKEAFGLTKEGYLDIEPTFDTRTFFAIRVTITGGANAMVATDVTLTGTDRDNATGTQVATDLQVTLRAAGAATSTVTWSTTEWVFTIDSLDGTAIVIAAPSAIIYADATEMLFGSAGGSSIGTDDVTTYVGDIPQDCTVEASLPSDYRTMAGPVEWNGKPLRLATWNLFASPESSSTEPSHYGLLGTKMRLWPSPSRQGICHFWYEYMPVAYASGYQQLAITGRFLGTATGLAATTPYYFKVAIDGAAVVEFTITTATDVTYDGVIDLMNTASIGCSWSLVGGKLRCTSDTLAGSSAIALAAGTTGTNLFATLTGWTAFETAVAATGTADITIPAPYEKGPVYYAAHVLAEQIQDYDVSDRMFSQFKRHVHDYTITKSNDSPKMSRGITSPPIPRVIV